MIARLTYGLVGRQWVRDAVADFLRAEGPRHFLLLGEPGSGKTAFLADLVRRHGYPHHFIGRGSRLDVSDSPTWRSPVRLAESLGYQLIRDYGGWVMPWEDWGIVVRQEVRDLQGLLVGARVGGFTGIPRPESKPVLTVEQDFERFGPAAQAIGVFIDKFQVDVNEVMSQLLLKPLQRVAERWPEHQVVVVIDGLDEAEDYMGASVVQLLPTGDLPRNIRFLLASRPVEHLTAALTTHARTFWLSEDEWGQRDPNTLDDARAYVKELTDEEPVRALLEVRGIKPESLGERVAEASGANFLYLHHYAAGIRDGDERLLTADVLPKGLYEIYAYFLSSIKAKRGVVPWTTAYKPVLGALAVAREPVTQRQLANFSGIERETVASIVLQAKQFLEPPSEEEDRRYALYHPSFGEFLTSEKNEDYIDGQKAHGRIAEHYLKEWGGLEKGLPRLNDHQRQGDWNPSDDYGLNSLVTHLIEAGAEEGLQAVFREAWMSARYERSNHTYTGFLADVNLAWHAVLARDKLDPLFLVRLETARRLVGEQVSAFTDRDLEALVWLKHEKQALAHARLRPDATAMFTSLLTIFQTLVRRGGPDPAVLEEAWQTARAIQQDSSREWAFLEMVPVLARAGRYGEAEKAAYAIQDETWRPSALHDLALVLAHMGHVDEALTAAHAVPQCVQKIAALRGLAEILVRVGDARWRAVLYKAVDAADGVADEGKRSIALTNLAADLARTGDERARPLFDEAAKIARTIGDLSERAIPLCDLATALAQVGDGRASEVFGEALDAAREVPDAGERAYTLTSLAASLSKTGDPRAHTVFDLTLKAIGLVQEKEGQGTTLTHLVKIMTKAGCYGHAREIIDLLQSEWQRATANRDLVIALAQTGGFDEALKEARTPNALREVAAILVRAGEDRASAVLDQALEAVRRMQPDTLRMAELRALSAILAEAGDGRAKDVFKEARAIAGASVSEEKVAAARWAIVSTLAGARSFVVAVKIARSLPDGLLRARALSSVAEAYVEARRYGEALGLAHEISHDWDRMGALCSLAAALTRAGDEQGRQVFNEAKEIADHIQGDDRRAMALCELAAAMAAAGDPRGDTVFDTVKKLSFAIENRLDRALRLEDLAAALARAGRYGEAKAVADRLEDGLWRASAQNAIAAALTADGRYAEAEETSHGINDVFMRGKALCNLATVLARTRHTGEARRITRGIESASWRVEALCALGVALAKTENGNSANEILSEAEEVIPGLEGPYERATALCQWAVALTEVGDDRSAAAIESAKEASLTIAADKRNPIDLEAQARVLDTLGAALARLGRYDEAAKAVRLISPKELRERAQQRVAVYLAASGRLSEALTTRGPCALDHFLQSLAELAASVERREPGLSMAVLREATGVSGWVRSDWRWISELLLQL